MPQLALPTTVYHGCNKKSVKLIKEGIEITKHEQGDFNRSENGRSFYTSEDESFAEYWAEHEHGDSAAVIQFQVDLNGLDYVSFQTRKTDSDLGAWQTFVSKNWIDHKRAIKEKGEVHDVVSGFVSNADELWKDKKDNDEPPSKFLYKPDMIGGKPATQVAFCSNKALDPQYIKFNRYKTLVKGEWTNFGKEIK